MIYPKQLNTSIRILSRATILYGIHIQPMQRICPTSLV
jgi:hypothetical protein